jgi:hypothetical protein
VASEKPEVHRVEAEVEASAVAAAPVDGGGGRAEDYALI